tara:strand:+ start:284 stop:415 length:132 start_codon:yes stop_codon:yes gene_type:complete
MKYIKEVIRIFRNIDSMYYEVLAYVIITALVMGGFTWIIEIIS